MRRGIAMLGVLGVAARVCFVEPAVAGPPQTAIKVCVEVTQKSWNDADHKPSATPPLASNAAGPTAPRAPEQAAPSTEVNRPPSMSSTREEQPSSAPQAKRHAPMSDEAGVRPELYLRRLLEYEVTHDETYEAVTSGCSERMTIELYALKEGWTVFGRFTRYAREERVNEVQADEFAALAERMAHALLHDRAIGETVTRNNVLRDDSEAMTRSIKGSSFAEVGLGTSVRIGVLPTASDTGVVESRLRVLTPLSILGGYREKVKGWGLEAFGRLDFGTSQKAARNNDPGGHVDYSWGAAMGLHFLRYSDPVGMGSLYFGGGATFELQRFTVIQDLASRVGDSRDDMWTGGLDLDGVAGYEFMRASQVHFYTQLTLSIPAYVMQNENTAGQIQTYMPGALAQIGLLF